MPETFDDKPFETVERLADSVRSWRAGTGFRSLRQALCNSPFMSLIVEANAKGRTLMAPP